MTSCALMTFQRQDSWIQATQGWLYEVSYNGHTGCQLSLKPSGWSKSYHDSPHRFGSTLGESQEIILTARYLQNLLHLLQLDPQGRSCSSYPCLLTFECQLIAAISRPCPPSFGEEVCFYIQGSQFPSSHKTEVTMDTLPYHGYPPALVRLRE